MGWIKAAVSTGTRETSATVHANKKIMSETLALRHSDRKYRFCFSAVLVNFRSCCQIEEKHGLRLRDALSFIYRSTESVLLNALT